MVEIQFLGSSFLWVCFFNLDVRLVIYGWTQHHLTELLRDLDGVVVETTLCKLTKDTNVSL